MCSKGAPRASGCHGGLLMTEAYSRCCCCCYTEDNKMCITDLNSTNGTVVNGQELSPMDNIEIEVGSEVIFGECVAAQQ